MNISLLGTLRVCVDVDPALLSDDSRFRRKLARGHLFRACYRGLAYRGRVFTSLDSALAALELEAEKLAVQHHAAGGPATATGLYLLDRVALTLHASHYLRAHAGRFWITP